MPRPLLLILLVATSLHAQVDDNFDDNSTAAQWSPLTDAPGDLDLTETNARLEATSAPSTNPNNDALYLSNFRLSTASDFEIAIDYTFTAATAQGIIGSAITLVLGVGRDLDGTDSAAIGYGYATASFGGFPLTAPGLGGAHRTDDAQTEVFLRPFAPNTGTFIVSYTASTDSLTLGDGTDSFTLDNKVRAAEPDGWNASSLLVSFGIRGSGFTVNPGDATLDNFTVRSGHVLSTPYDFWAVRSGLAHSINNAPSDDPDLDGLTNLDEFAHGTDPLAPDTPEISTSLTTAFSVTFPHLNTLTASGDTTTELALTGDGIVLTASSSLPLTITPNPPGFPALPAGYTYTTISTPTAPTALVTIEITASP